MQYYQNALGCKIKFQLQTFLDGISKTKYYYQPDKKNVGIPHKEIFTYILNNTSFNKYTSNTSHWQERHTVKMKSKRERL